MKKFGNDNISTYFLKLALPYINYSLVYMFNKSIEKGESPTNWKMARSTPILKKVAKVPKLIANRFMPFLSLIGTLKS